MGQIYELFSMSLLLLFFRRLFSSFLSFRLLNFRLLIFKGIGMFWGISSSRVSGCGGFYSIIKDVVDALRIKDFSRFSTCSYLCFWPGC